MEENNLTTQNLGSYTFDLQSDESGNWDFTIDKDLSEGPHILMIEDEHGNTDEALIYIIKQNQTSTTDEGFGLVDRVTTIAPQISSVIIWSLVFLVTIASVNMARLAKQADAEAVNLPRKTKYFGINIFIALFFILVAFGLVLFFNHKSGYFKINKEKSEIIINQVSGRLLDPITFLGIKADLNSGDTTIKTSESGYFIFNQVLVNQGINLTHPELQRTITLFPDKDKDNQIITWYFSPSMYNILIQTLDDEARGKFDNIYKKLPLTILQKVDHDKFIIDYKTQLKPSNVKDQTILIKDIVVLDQWISKKYNLLFDKVYCFVILNNEEVENYYLVNEEESWKIIKE